MKDKPKRDVELTLWPKYHDYYFAAIFGTDCFQICHATTWEVHEYCLTQMDSFRLLSTSVRSAESARLYSVSTEKTIFYLDTWIESWVIQVGRLEYCHVMKYINTLLKEIVGDRKLFRSFDNFLIFRADEWCRGGRPENQQLVRLKKKLPNTREILILDQIYCWVYCCSLFFSSNWLSLYKTAY